MKQYYCFPRRGNGFTLIELVLVIVILGILASTIIPKFGDLSTQARINSIKVLAGAIQSAANNLRMVCAVNTSCNLNNDQWKTAFNFYQACRK